MQRPHNKIRQIRRVRQHQRRGRKGQIKIHLSTRLSSIDQKASQEGSVGEEGLEDPFHHRGELRGEGWEEGGEEAEVIKSEAPDLLNDGGVKEIWDGAGGICVGYICICMCVCVNGCER